ncbi:tetratricopeptide repeat protein [Candidatus Magnetaquicoccus inordinatus]|uniref:tetratricopeptide repeat protein n=1 Tax=Candidatus Magnetaquicoccus inordinatus TaxID=2496818 RepID=UPI00187D2DB3|nr:tetratricopeptide repeat protein [Candidatus Magnetaquicoccus inordinatus]
MSEQTLYLREQLAASIRLHQAGQLPEAIALYQLLLQQFPGHPRILHPYGLACQEAGDLRSATNLLSQAAIRDPDNPDILLSLGVLLKNRQMSRAALERFRDFQQRCPNHPEAHFYLGDTLMDLGEAEAAIPPFRNAIQLRPHFQEAWINLGLCLKASGQLEEARHCFEQVVTHYPQLIAGHINLALTALLMEDYHTGWREYEWRLQASGEQACLHKPKILLHNPGIPRWLGSPLHGQTILVLAEQGFGDTLQFVRYLPMLKAMGARILLTCQSALLPLLRNMDCIDSLSTPEQFQCQETIDCYSPLLSLPLALHTQAENIPASVPYLWADPQLQQSWQQRLSALKNRRIGLVWQGKPLHQNDPLRRRSCPWEALAPLAALPDISWISLQKDPNRQTPLPPHPGMSLLDLNNALTDFAQTAAIVSQLDLLITIDTAVAHLAGALGKPVWLLLPLAPDWRWSQNPTSTPWYPGMRMFRQQIANDWHAPIQQMVAQLQKDSSLADCILVN